MRPKARGAVCFFTMSVRVFSLNPGTCFMAGTSRFMVFSSIMPTSSRSIAAAFWAEMDIPTHVGYYMERGMSKKDAIKEAARDRGVAKNEVYQKML